MKKIRRRTWKKEWEWNVVFLFRRSIRYRLGWHHRSFFDTTDRDLFDWAIVWRIHNTWRNGCTNEWHCSAFDPYRSNNPSFHWREHSISVRRHLPLNHPIDSPCNGSRWPIDLTQFASIAIRMNPSRTRQELRESAAANDEKGVAALQRFDTRYTGERVLRRSSDRMQNLFDEFLAVPRPKSAARTMNGNTRFCPFVRWIFSLQNAKPADDQRSPRPIQTWIDRLSSGPFGWIQFHFRDIEDRI